MTCLDCARAACGYRPCPKHERAAAIAYEAPYLARSGSSPYTPHANAWSLGDSSIVRTDDDPATDCTWREWREANADTADPDLLREVATALASRGRYDEPAGGSAGWCVAIVAGSDR